MHTERREDYEWSNQVINFDDLSNAFIAVFFVTTSGWGDQMFALMDSAPEIDYQPEVGHEIAHSPLPPSLVTSARMYGPSVRHSRALSLLFLSLPHFFFRWVCV